MLRKIKILLPVLLVLSGCSSEFLENSTEIDETNSLELELGAASALSSEGLPTSSSGTFFGSTLTQQELEVSSEAAPAVTAETVAILAAVATSEVATSEVATPEVVATPAAVATPETEAVPTAVVTPETVAAPAPAPAPAEVATPEAVTTQAAEFAPEIIVTPAATATPEVETVVLTESTPIIALAPVTVVTAAATVEPTVAAASTVEPAATVEPEVAAAATVEPTVEPTATVTESTATITSETTPENTLPVAAEVTPDTTSATVEEPLSGSLASTKEEVVEVEALIVQPDICDFPVQESTIQSSWTDTQSGLGVPDYLSSITEPNGHKITRVSSNSNWGASNGDATHQYSKRQAWNADESLMEIGERTVDTNSLQIVNGLIPVASERNWSNVNPDLMLGMYYNPLPNEFVAANVRTGEVTSLHKFDGYSKCTLGDFEGSVSDNDEKIMLACTDSNSGQKRLIAYDIANDSILGTIDAKYNFNWGSFSPSGDYILVENQVWPDPDPQLLRYNADFTNPTVISNETEHGDFGYDDNGDEIYAMLRWDVIFYFRLKDGTRVDMSVSGNGNGIGNGHLSCRNSDRPGWCYVTTGTESRILGIKMSESAPAAELWGFHRSGYEDYKAQPKGTVSRSGGKVLFTSHWYNRGEINDYLLECNAL